MTATVPSVPSLSYSFITEGKGQGVMRLTPEYCIHYPLQVSAISFESLRFLDMVTTMSKAMPISL